MSSPQNHFTINEMPLWKNLSEKSGCAYPGTCIMLLKENMRKYHEKTK